MSPNRPCFSPADSDDLFDSLTGECVYSAKKTIWHDSTADLERYKTLDDAIKRLTRNGKKIIIKKLSCHPSEVVKDYYSKLYQSTADINYFISQGHDIPPPAI